MNGIIANSPSSHRQHRMRRFFLIACLGLIGADRIDLFAAHGPFTMTPFLFLASLAVLAAILPKWLRGSVSLEITPPIQRQLPFVILTGIFLALTLLSIPAGLDPLRGVVAFADLLLVATLGYSISALILVEPDRARLIQRSVSLGLIVYLIFCLGQCIAFAHNILLDLSLEHATWLERSFGALTVGPWIPRLDGSTVDPNRAGFILTMYAALLDRFCIRSRSRSFLQWAIALFILLTMSKSAILCWLAYHVCSKSTWKRLLAWKVALPVTALAAFAFVFYVTNKTTIDVMADAWNISDALSERVSVDEGSSGQSHILLIERGIDTWLTSPKTVFMGIGYASAYEELSDILNTGSKFGNFHCLYVSVLAEQGLPAFICMVFILLVPLFRRKYSAQATFAVLVFNITYQTTAEPMFWMSVALLWSLTPREHVWLGVLRRVDAIRATVYG
jgi:hypothetical protein